MASTAPSGDMSNYSGTSSNYGAKFNPTTAVAIVVLIAGSFLLAFVSVLVRRCMRGNTTFLQSGVGLQGSYVTKSRGLAKAEVDALPLVHTTDLGEKHDRECPVCLTDFEPEETLRLLPSCKHVFHRECIDAWFDSHSTCPLCRASLLSGETELNSTPDLEQVSPGEPVASITEVSENGDSGNELHRGVSEVPSEDSRASTGAASQSGAMIARENERSSARGPLFRNSESFKRAARGVAAHENAAAMAEKTPSFSKPPLTPASGSIRRSSSISADLISLRNLLMGGDQSAISTDAPAASSRWFSRVRSFESRNRDVQVNEYASEPTRDEWVSIDLETGKALEAQPRSLKDESSQGREPERSWSDRFTLSSLKSLKGIAILSRSTSDVSSRHAPHLPI